MKSLVLFRKVCNMVYCCELDVDWQKYSREELAYLCERYCEQMDMKK